MELSDDMSTKGANKFHLLKVANFISKRKFKRFYNKSSHGWFARTMILVTSDAGDHGGDQAGPHWPTDSPGPELATSGHTRQPQPGLFAVTTATVHSGRTLGL